MASAAAKRQTDSFSRRASVSWLSQIQFQVGTVRLFEDTSVNGLAFGFGTGNGGGAQPAKNYTLSAFSHAFTTFNSTATGSMST